MKTHKTVASILLTTIALSGCSYFRHNQETKPASLQQICKQLRRGIVFNNNTPAGPNILQNTPTQQARLMRSYDQYNCEALEPGNQ